MSTQSKADMKASMRWAIVTVTICSWIAVSNHCAFAAVATENDRAQSECPFHSNPAKQKEPSSQVQCCKTLRAVVAAQSKAWEPRSREIQRRKFSCRDGSVRLVFAANCRAAVTRHWAAITRVFIR